MAFARVILFLSITITSDHFSSPENIGILAQEKLVGYVYLRTGTTHSPTKLTTCIPDAEVESGVTVARE